MNDGRQRNLWRLTVMTTVLIATLIVLMGLTQRAVTATETEASAISSLIFEGQVAVVSDDVDSIIAAQFELYDVVMDEYTSVECQIYADVGLTAVTIQSQLAYFPESIGLDSLHDTAMEFIQTTKFDCEVGL